MIGRNIKMFVTGQPQVILKLLKSRPFTIGEDRKTYLFGKECTEKPTEISDSCCGLSRGPLRVRPSQLFAPTPLPPEHGLAEPRKAA